MRVLLICLLAFSALFAADTPVNKKPSPAKKTTEKAKSTAPKASTKTAKAKTAKKVPEQKIPNGAEKLSDTEWRYVDADNKAWIYRRTPFGIAKISEEKALEMSDAPRHAAGAPLQIRDLGESVEFSRKTPFGLSKWEKKKTELTEQEQAAYDAFLSVKLK